MKLPQSTEVFLAGIFLGTISIFSVLLRDSNISSFQQVFFRFLIPLIIFLGILVITKSEWIKRKDILKFILLGAILCMLYVTYLSALFVGVPIIEAVFLVNLQPFFIILIGLGFLGEKIKRTRIFAAVLTVFGALLLIQIWMIEALRAPPIGYILGILNALAYALYILINKRIRRTTNYNDITTITFTFIFGLMWMVILLTILNIFGVGGTLINFNFNMDQITWTWIFGISILSTLIPYFLLNIGIKKIAPTRVGIIMLIEPLVVAMFGILLFRETLVPIQIVGAVIILLGVIISERA